MARYLDVVLTQNREYRFDPTMDLNYILSLAAVLNLIGDLVSIIPLRSRLPSWLLPANVVALVICALSWFCLPSYSGTVAIGVLVIYMTAVRFGLRSDTERRPRIGVATGTLIALNIASFARQWFESETNTFVDFIIQGAVYGPEMPLGEWWRFFVAQFLHFNLIHLAFNMFGLWFLAPLTERLIGPWRLVLVYIVSGLAGMLVAFGFYTVTSPNSVFLLLGASANVMGLVGLQAALSLRAYRRSGSTFARSQLLAMVQIVALQCVFDFMVPEVSSVAHLGGALAGFLMGLLLNRERARVVSA